MWCNISHPHLLWWIKYILGFTAKEQQNKKQKKRAIQIEK